MQTKTHTTFPLIESKLEPYNPKISVLSAVNKLKETEQKILQAKKRQVVQKRVEQAILAREEEKKKTQMFKRSVRNSLEMERNTKRQAISKREQQVEQLHNLTSTFRESKHRFRQTFKSLQKQQTQKIYSSVKSQRQRNEELIEEFKKRELQLKKSHRQRMAEREEKSKERVEEFRHSRILYIQKERERDVEELEKKILLKAKFLERLNESQQDFANSRTRLRYRSNSSFNNQSKKQDGEQVVESIGEEKMGEKQQNDHKIQLNSMVNPERQEHGDSKIFGLTSAIGGETIPHHENDQKAKQTHDINSKEKTIEIEKIENQASEKDQSVSNKNDKNPSEKHEQEVVEQGLRKNEGLKHEDGKKEVEVM